MLSGRSRECGVVFLCYCVVVLWDSEAGAFISITSCMHACIFSKIQQNIPEIRVRHRPLSDPTCKQNSRLFEIELGKVGKVGR